ncbi:MAG: hypothetical protein AB1585_06550 [Thermodesulfobacteriota bacterium]
MKKTTGVTYLAIISAVVVFLAVLAAIFIMDPPGVQRKRRIDDHRVNHLKSISRAIDSFWERNTFLPADLTTLNKEPGLKTPLKDPETGGPYIYGVLGKDAYRLCAVFSVDSSEEAVEYNSSRQWSHGAGKHCFDLKPPIKNQKKD